VRKGGEEVEVKIYIYRQWDLRAFALDVASAAAVSSRAATAVRDGLRG